LETGTESAAAQTHEILLLGGISANPIRCKVWKQKQTQVV
jgi:hypothetical protein